MAVSSNVGQGNRTIVFPIAGVEAFDPFEMHKTPKYALGTKVELADGTVYRYAHLGADTNRGLLVATDISESCQVDTDNVIVAPASCQTTTDGTAGQKFIEITLASVTANQFAGGKIIITDDTGEGYTYRIKGNTATGDPASGNFRLELYDNLQASLDATSDFAIWGPIYANLEGATAGTDMVPVGVTCSTFDVSDKAYGWILTKGIVGILQDGTIAAGDLVALSDGVTGAVHAAAGGGTAISDLIAEALVGVCVIAGDSTGHGVFKINLE